MGGQNRNIFGGTIQYDMDSSISNTEYDTREARKLLRFLGQYCFFRSYKNKGSVINFIF